MNWQEVATVVREELLVEVEIDFGGKLVPSAMLVVVQLNRLRTAVHRGDSKQVREILADVTLRLIKITDEHCPNVEGQPEERMFTTAANTAPGAHHERLEVLIWPIIRQLSNSIAAHMDPEVADAVFDRCVHAALWNVRQLAKVLDVDLEAEIGEWIADVVGE